MAVDPKQLEAMRRLAELCNKAGMPVADAGIVDEEGVHHSALKDHEDDLDEAPGTEHHHQGGS